MKMSDVIADMILDMFDDNTPTVQIQRNDLAQRIGCVPSQINYVITSRFTPEQGYHIESRRGGGGCILITRAGSKADALVSLINAIGDTLDEKTANAYIFNLKYQNLIDENSARIMSSALSDNVYKGLLQDEKNIIRARQFKQMLVAYIN